MANKAQERIYAEHAAKLLNLEWHIEPNEEPDFAVETITERFGLEVTQVYVDGRGKKGSGTKSQESLNRRAVLALATQYYRSGGTPILAKFLGAMPKEGAETLVQSMVAVAQKLAGTDGTLETNGLKVFMTPLPASLNGYSRWIVVSDKVGWVGQIKPELLQPVIDSKGEKLHKYKSHCQSIDLLIVADRTYKSGMLVGSDQLMVTNPGFRHIYFMSYPESIHRVG